MEAVTSLRTAVPASAGGRDRGHHAPVHRATLRVGVDVGGTFTKAVALDSVSLELCAQAVVPTTHAAASGVTQGVVEALELLLAELGSARDGVDLVAFSTTQAMNALLEGDVARVGVIGLGAAPDLRLARRRTRVGEIALAPGRSLHTEHEFIDVTRGLDEGAVDAALARLARAGCAAVAVSGAFAVDSPEHETAVVERGARLGLPACAGHELSGAYGLETRTVSAAINAAILPVVERTATFVRRGLEQAGVRAPLLVLRGDGGAMSADAFRRRPSLTVGSGPAAGVAAALHRAGVADAVVVECGGTSTNVSAIKRGRPVLRSIKVMGRPTAIRSIDSWVVGAAGGSLPLLGRRRLAEVGPRSAHLAGLPYASFADPAELGGAELELIAPEDGDPDRYAVVAANGRRFGLTVTCASNALGLVAEGAHAHGSRAAALAGFAPLARRLGLAGPEEAARAVLEGALEKIALAVRDAAGSHDLGPQVPLVALGGAAEALVPELARRLGRPVARPAHPEVLSSIGAAISLVRAELTRAPRPSGRAPGDVSGRREARLEIAWDAERACVEAGAAPGTVAVETSYEPDEGVVRAVATGAVALEAGAARREAASRAERLAAAARELGIDRAMLDEIFEGEFYAAYAERSNGGCASVAVIDGHASVPLVEASASVVLGEGEDFLQALADAVESASVNLGIASVLPRVSLLAGPRLLDLSDARRADEVLTAVRRAIEEHPGTACAVIAR
jgi:N-methylhydantoinase A/oxoprolinase/acetone carboxylase beta subunit